MLNTILKSAVLLKIYLWIKPRLLGLVILFSAIFIISYSHAEYIAWVEISGKKIFLGYSYILKNILIVLSILIYFFLINRVKKSKSELGVKTDSKNLKNFEKLKEKGKLKTDYERILEGTDEKD